MRIDEFSNASGIDGSVSTTEQTQFLLFGFDIGLSAAVVVETPIERIFCIDAESRVYAIGSEDRVYAIDLENRVYAIQ